MLGQGPGSVVSLTKFLSHPTVIPPCDRQKVLSEALPYLEKDLEREVQRDVCALLTAALTNTQLSLLTALRRQL